MNRGSPFSWLLLPLLLLSSSVLQASKTDSLDFDIFRRNNSLSVLLDLSSLVSAKRVGKMKEGIDLAFEYQLTLARPKKLWGVKTVRRVTGVLKTGYRIVTEDFFLSIPGASETEDRYFSSLAELHRFLSDSILVDLANLDSLDYQLRYVLRLKLVCISLTSLNLAPSDGSAASSESPVKYLFKRFLVYTGFGRQEYSTESRLFSLSEIRLKE